MTAHVRLPSSIWVYGECRCGAVYGAKDIVTSDEWLTWVARWHSGEGCTARLFPEAVQYNRFYREKGR